MKLIIYGLFLWIFFFSSVFLCSFPQVFWAPFFSNFNSFCFSFFVFYKLICYQKHKEESLAILSVFTYTFLSNRKVIGNSFKNEGQIKQAAYQTGSTVSVLGEFHLLQHLCSRVDVETQMTCCHHSLTKVAGSSQSWTLYSS